MSRRRDPEAVVVPDVTYDLPTVGARVRDRETDGELLVVDVFARTAAANHVFQSERSVADENPDYDPAAPVIECAYLDDLDEERDVDVLRKGPEFRDLRTYHFPVDRLDVLENGEGGDVA